MRATLIAALAVCPLLGQNAAEPETPPGDRLPHDAAGYARVMCNAVFLTGLDPEFAAENVGYFVAPMAQRAKLGKPEVDRAARTVRVSGVTAQDIGSQGCAVLPIRFKPVAVKKSVSPTALWPKGDSTPSSLPTGIDLAKVKQAVDAAFEPAGGMTAAFVVT